MMVDQAYQDILQTLMKRVMMYTTVYARHRATPAMVRKAAVAQVEKECLQIGVLFTPRLRQQLTLFKVLA